MKKDETFSKNELKEIGKRLRVYRGKKSVREFAKEVGITYSRLGYIEGGQNEPTLRDIVQYHKKFNISYDYVLGLTNESSTDIEVKKMHEKYGLMKKTLNRLKQLKDSSYSYNDFLQKINGLFFESLNIYRHAFDIHEDMSRVMHICSLSKYIISCIEKNQEKELEDYFNNCDYSLNRIKDFCNYNTLFMYDNTFEEFKDIYYKIKDFIFSESKNKDKSKEMESLIEVFVGKFEPLNNKIVLTQRLEKLDMEDYFKYYLSKMDIVENVEDLESEETVKKMMGKYYKHVNYLNKKEGE